MTLMTFNSVMAGAIALAAIGAVARMDKKTNCAVRWGVVLLVVGAAGQAIGFAAGVWDHYLDTLLYGSILTILVANQRQPQWIAERWSRWLAYGVTVATLTIVAFYWISGPARAADATIEPPYVVVPLDMDRGAGTVTLWISDVQRLIHDRAWLIDELGRMRVGCGGA